jgi:RNA polymerase sigma factor (sigma-70 family)
MVDAAIADNFLAHEDECAMARRIASGDHAAFELLMRQHNRRLYRLARSTLRDRTEAEDALQDAYVCVYRSIGEFRGEASLSTWLSRLLLNECFARLRRSARRQNVIALVSPNAPIESTMAENEPEAPDTELARAQMRDLLERKLDELPENFRTVFVLRSVEEMSVDETAGCLGIPEETVRSRHFRAKTMLRESLAQELNFAERDVFQFGGAHCDRVVAKVLARLASEP